VSQASSTTLGDEAGFLRDRDELAMGHSRLCSAEAVTAPAASIDWRCCLKPCRRGAVELEETKRVGGAPLDPHRVDRSIEARCVFARERTAGGDRVAKRRRARIGAMVELAGDGHAFHDDVRRRVERHWGDLIGGQAKRVLPDADAHCSVARRCESCAVAAMSRRRMRTNARPNAAAAAVAPPSDSQTMRFMPWFMGGLIWPATERRADVTVLPSTLRAASTLTTGAPAGWISPTRR
jgi:hypothetical protein